MTDDKKKYQNKLYRSETDRVIAGVAGGLGAYLGIDSVIIRILFAITTLVGGGGLILYILMWIIVPTKSRITSSHAETVKDNTKEVKEYAQNIFGDKEEDSNNSLGLILVAVGLFFLASNFGWLDWLDISQLWPLALIGIGVLAMRKK